MSDAQTVVGILDDLQADWPEHLWEVRIAVPGFEQSEEARKWRYEPSWGRVYNEFGSSGMGGKIPSNSVGMIYAPFWYWSQIYGGRFDQAPGREIIHIPPLRPGQGMIGARAFEDYDTMADTLIALAEGTPMPRTRNTKLKNRLLR